MMCGADSGADSIDAGNALLVGGTPRVFDEVYAPSTLGIFLREFTFGHANQVAAVGHTYRITGSGDSWKATNTFGGKTEVLAENVGAKAAWRKCVNHSEGVAK